MGNKADSMTYDAIQMLRKSQSRTCPRCGGGGLLVPHSRNAMSRADNDTFVCASCKVEEAVLVRAGYDPWPGFPEQVCGPRA